MDDIDTDEEVSVDESSKKLPTEAVARHISTHCTTLTTATGVNTGIEPTTQQSTQPLVPIAGQSTQSSTHLISAVEPQVLL